MNLPKKKEEDEYIISLDLNSSWMPPRARDEVEHGITIFENEIETQLKVRTPNRQMILTYYQLHATKELHQREDVCDSDKNLGPSAGNSASCKSQIYEEHLDMEASTEVTEDEANEMNAETKEVVRKMFHVQCGLKKAELTYLGCSFKMTK
jgi:hypothetical protein